MDRRHTACGSECDFVWSHSDIRFRDSLAGRCYIGYWTNLELDCGDSSS